VAGEYRKQELLLAEKDKINNQVVSRQRVIDHGEVYTSEREVNAMLDLVKQETERIESRFLEPACGTGNFLIEIIDRKMDVVTNRYKKNQIDFERYSVLAFSSIYGIDILEDNVNSCRNRLLNYFEKKYKTIYKDKIKTECIDAIRFILDHNIIWGDALTLKTVGNVERPIVFSEWSFALNNMIKRRDYSFQELLTHSDNELGAEISDKGEKVFFPEPLHEYPLIHFLRIENDKYR